MTEAEDHEAIFDPSMKKKKKKKKTPFDLDAALGGETQNEEPSAEPANEYAEASTNAANQEAEPEGEESSEKTKATIDDFNLDDIAAMKKKKRKKKTVFNMDGIDSALPEIEETSSRAEPEGDSLPLTDAMPGMEDLDITLTKKKRRRKKKRFEEMEGEVEDGEGDGKTEGGVESSELKDTSGTTWAGTERDYTYDELLTRVFDIMRSKNPDMVTGEKKRFVMRPPQVVRVGTKKSSFVNFTEICKMLHRPTEHLLNFLLAELGTSGSIDGNNQLIIKGRFQQKQMESVLRRYIKEYVTCHTCRSSETFLHKENRLFFLQCERCQSRCSVASIKSGFQAVTGKRAQIRAKAN